MKAKPHVLFLCTHNAARSQMAEAMLRHLAGDRFEVSSAGLQPTAVHPLTHKVLGELGIDSSSLRAKRVDEFLGKATIHQAIMVCPLAEGDCPHIYPFAMKTLRWPLADPVGGTGSDEERLIAFRHVRDAISERLRDWLKEMP